MKHRVGLTKLLDGCAAEGSGGCTVAEMPAQKTQSPRKRVWPRTGEIVLLLIAAFCLLVLLTQDLGLVTRFYSPLVIVLLIVVFVEYLIIKGGDRSRLYLLELERMREREQEQIARVRRALEETHRAAEQLDASKNPADGSNAAEAAVAVAKDCLKRVEHVLRPDLKE